MNEQLIRGLMDRGYQTIFLSNRDGEKPCLPVDFTLSSLPDVDDVILGFNEGVDGKPVLAYFENTAALRHLPDYCNDPEFLNKAGATESPPRAFFIDLKGPSARLS